MENPFNGEERFCATSRKELTVEIFVTEYPHLLAYLCRRAVLENAPFELTRETIKHYGFSREDVKLLRDCIASNNRRIIDECARIRAAESHRLPAGSASKKAGAEA